MIGVRRVVSAGWPVAAIWLAVFGVWLIPAWMLFPGARPMIVLFSCLFLLLVAAACVQRSPRLADPAQHEPVGEVPSASTAGPFAYGGVVHGPTAEQREIVVRLQRRVSEPLTDEEWQRFADAIGIEDAAARRTQLTEGDDQ